MANDIAPTLFSLVRFAREMRRAPTRSEALLWAQLRGRRLGVHFRRQHVFPLGYVVDFYCCSARLVVEVDGSIHTLADIAARDIAREAAIARTYDVRFLRIDAHLVERDTFAAVALVRAAL